jgi:glycosyltransferase involved in cell wall biosynthesis
MRICLIGKFPPIQGGVSMRTYWSAHRLAARGHDVAVVTNAKEAAPPFRLHMRSEDWERCAGNYGAGRVTVHWTDPADSSQAYLPMASPFVSKLATIAAGLHAEKPFDVILSHYLEPYGVAGYLAAQMTGVAHVVRMAGSDSGRLWHHPQLALLYDHVLRSARAVIASGVVAERAIARGVNPAKIAPAEAFPVPEEIFTPLGPTMDFTALRSEVAHDPELRDSWWGEFDADCPYFAVFGKLGERKGSFALLSAMQRLKQQGVNVGLVAMAHGRPEIEKEFRDEVRARGLIDRVLQIPFVPHWRVPEFLRGCLAVCCLEQGFPIAHHTPIIPLEVLMCGKCLVGSTEIIRKLPDHGRLPNGYGCVAIEDVNDIARLSGTLAAIAQDPAPSAAVGARGYAFARDLQSESIFPQALERILIAAAAGEDIADVAADRVAASDGDADDDHFPLTRLAATMPALRLYGQTADTSGAVNLSRAREILEHVEHLGNGEPRLAALAAAVRVEIAVATAESMNAQSFSDEVDSPFAGGATRWAIGADDIGPLLPIRGRNVQLLTFDHDISTFRDVRRLEDLPVKPVACPSYMVVFAGGDARAPLVVDPVTARILELSDGTRTASDIMEQLKQEDAVSAAVDDELGWIETLFIEGLLRLRHTNFAPRQLDATLPSFP